MNIAIFGATSQIAQDLMVNFALYNDTYKLTLFGRKERVIREWAEKKLLTIQYEVCEYSSFDVNQKFDVIINFVGVGNPAEALKLGDEILQVTEYYDNLILEYLRVNADCKYLFMSSGAVYGGDYHQPVSDESLCQIDLNNLQQTDLYGIAKLYAESKHRAMNDFSIVDVRIFNYFSHTQDMNARFLITDIVRAIQNQDILLTSSENIIRDFITSIDFYYLINLIIHFKPLNVALDLYSKNSVEKLQLLSELHENYGLRYEFSKNSQGLNATGNKKNYYSTFFLAQKIGYQPSLTSLEGIRVEMELYFAKVAKMNVETCIN